MGISDKEKRLNLLALEKIRLTSDYLKLNRQVEQKLDEYRMNLAKTRSTVGVPMANVTLLDNRETDASVRLNVDENGVFTLIKGKSKRNMRNLFGFMRPECVNRALRNIEEALELICELSTTKYQVNEINRQYMNARISVVNQSDQAQLD